MKLKWIYVVPLIVFLWECGVSRTLRMDIRYLSGTPAEKVERGRVVAVNPFRDVRGERGPLGVWRRPGNRMDTFVASKPVDQAITQAVSDYFLSRGYRVVPYTGWDLTPGGLSRIPADFVVGGEVINLKSEAWTRVRTRVEVLVQLGIHVGRVSEGRVLSQKMEISKEIIGVTSRPERIEKTLNEEVSEAIDRVFQGLL